MFSSNQVFEISGDYNQLESALRFAFQYEGNDENLSPSEIARGCKTLYQITDDGKYCIGWGFKNVPEGWCEYPFDFEYGIVSKIIAQHLRKQPQVKNKYEWADGSTSEGFLMRCPDNMKCEEKEHIIESFYCIVCFEKYTNFYAK